MNRLLAIVVAALLASLLILQVAHAARRIRMISDRTAEDALADLRGEVSRQAARLEDDLALGKAHARYLASLESVRALLDGGRPDDAARAGRDAAAVLLHFPSFGGVVVLDDMGNERLRVERMGGGVATVPGGLLRERADPERAEAALKLAPGEVSVSPLEFDASRVDLAEEDRLVLRYAARVGAKSPGVVVLSLYAAPFFEALRRVEPIPGVRMILVDATGNYLVDSERGREVGRARPSAVSFAKDQSQAYTALVSRGLPVVRVGADGFVAAPTGPRLEGAKPAWTLIAHAPASALERGAASLRSEALGVGLVLLLTMVAIGVVGLVLMRLAAESARVAAERDAERKLVESERLAALGRLTAGVSHEINNPLAGIGNYLALLEREGASPELRAEYIGLVRHGFERIRAIVRDLLSFANPPKPRREPVDLTTILDRVERVTRHDRGFRDITWARNIARDLPSVSADPFALEQVFLNLALNARDAMQREFSAEGVHATGAIEVDARVDPQSPDRVEIRFEDSGPGIPPDVLPRLFEPFFTTRKSGTGLGLSVSSSIIRAHGGTIRAENREDGGARFVITIPAAANVPVATGAPA